MNRYKTTMTCYEVRARATYEELRVQNILSGFVIDDISKIITEYGADAELVRLKKKHNGDWDAISKDTLSDKFIETYQKFLDWKSVTISHINNVQFLRHWSDLIDWTIFSSFDFTQIDAATYEGCKEYVNIYILIEQPHFFEFETGEETAYKLAAILPTLGDITDVLKNQLCDYMFMIKMAHLMTFQQVDEGIEMIRKIHMVIEEENNGCTPKSLDSFLDEYRKYVRIIPERYRF